MKNLTGTVIQRNSQWYWVICGFKGIDYYGKPNPKYTIADVYKAKNGKIIANIINFDNDTVSRVIEKSTTIKELPEKYKTAYQKLNDNYNLF